MARVTQTTGCWFLGKCLRRLEVWRQMATWCTDSPMRLRSQQEIHLWDGSLRVMPQIWVWWRTQEPRASNGDSQPSLKGFLRAQMCRALNLIQLCLSLQGFLKRCLIRLYTVHTEFYIQQKCLELLCQCTSTTSTCVNWITIVKELHLLNYLYFTLIHISIFCYSTPFIW